MVEVPALSASHTIFVWFFVMLLGTAAMVAFAIWNRRRAGPTGRATVLLGVSLVSVGILPQALQRPDSAHLLWSRACVPVLRRHRRGTGRRVLANPRSPSRRRHRRSLHARPHVHGDGPVHVPLLPPAHRIGLGQVASPFRVGAATATSTWVTAKRTSLCRLRSTSSARSPSPVIGCSSAPTTCAAPGTATCSSTGCCPVEPATYYIEMDPGLANAEGSSLAGDVASADWVLLTGLWDGWTEPNSSVDFGSGAPNQVLRDEFCVVGTWEDSQATLYARNPTFCPYDGLARSSSLARRAARRWRSLAAARPARACDARSCVADAGRRRTPGAASMAPRPCGGPCAARRRSPWRRLPAWSPTAGPSSPPSSVSGRSRAAR